MKMRRLLSYLSIIIFILSILINVKKISAQSMYIGAKGGFTLPSLTGGNSPIQLDVANKNGEILPDLVGGKIPVSESYKTHIGVNAGAFLFRQSMGCCGCRQSP